MKVTKKYMKDNSITITGILVYKRWLITSFSNRE